jgi:hypothetical protein
VRGWRFAGGGDGGGDSSSRIMYGGDIQRRMKKGIGSIMAYAPCGET